MLASPPPTPTLSMSTPSPINNNPTTNNDKRYQPGDNLTTETGDENASEARRHSCASRVTLAASGAICVIIEKKTRSVFVCCVHVHSYTLRCVNIRENRFGTGALATSTAIGVFTRAGALPNFLNLTNCCSKIVKWE